MHQKKGNGLKQEEMFEGANSVRGVVGWGVVPGSVCNAMFLVFWIQTDSCPFRSAYRGDSVRLTVL